MTRSPERAGQTACGAGEPAAQNSAALSWLWHLCRGSRIAVVVLLCVQVCLGAISVSYALALRGIVDQAVAANREGLWQASLLLVGLMVAQIALGAVQRWLAERTKAILENRCKQQLFTTLLGKDYAQVTAVHSGEWMNRLTSDTVIVANGLVEIIPNVGGMVTRIVGAVCALLVMEPLFGWVLVPCGVLIIVLTWGFRRVLKRLHKRVQEADGRFRVFAQERLENLLVVRSFAKEAACAAEAQQRMDDHRAARMRRIRFSNVCNIGFSALMQGAYVAAAVYCGWAILAGVMTYGMFIAVLQLVNQVQSPFANISGYLPRWYAMTASAERLMAAERFAGEGEEPAVDAQEIERIYADDFKALGLRDVTFGYAAASSNPDAAAGLDDAGTRARARERASAGACAGEGNGAGIDGGAGACAEQAAAPLVLDNFSFELCKGDCVALMGPSGQGKSTILKLLMCLYRPRQGSCYLRSADGERALTAAWRGLFAYVPQGNQLMSGTIRSCVAFGDEAGASDEALMRMLDIACVGDVVRALDAGLDAELGERGAGLSEGQLQRIAIARALYSGHPILLLDEATSALDAQTECELLHNLQQLTDRTVLLVSHREAVLSICNKHVRLG